MATLENRSRFCVTVRNRSDLTRHFPFVKLAQAQTYRAGLSAQGLKAKVDPLDEHWLVRIRATGYRPLTATFETREEADVFVQVEEERRRGLFIDCTMAHKTSLAELLVRSLEKEAWRNVRVRNPCVESRESLTQRATRP